MKSQEGFTIVELSDQHPVRLFLEVASLHIREISHAVLPRLGPDLLALVYREIARQPGSGLWVALDQEKVAGFISGCSDTRTTFARAILGTSVSLSRFAMGMLLGFRIIQFLRIILYPVRKVSGSSHAFTNCRSIRPDLLSIVVSVDYQHCGVGKRMVETFEESLREWDIPGYYRVASDLSVPGSQLFYLHFGFQPCHTLTLNDSVLQIYVKEIPQQV